MPPRVLRPRCPVWTADWIPIPRLLLWWLDFTVVADLHALQPSHPVCTTRLRTPRLVAVGRSFVRCGYGCPICLILHGWFCTRDLHCSGCWIPGLFPFYTYGYVALVYTQFWFGGCSTHSCRFRLHYGYLQLRLPVVGYVPGHP